VKTKQTIENIKLATLNKITSYFKNPSRHDFGCYGNSTSEDRDIAIRLLLEDMEYQIEEAKAEEKKDVETKTRALKMKKATQSAQLKTVLFPACENHEGRKAIEVCLRWICPVCGEPRGEIKKTDYIDGSGAVLKADGWENGCGHKEKMRKIRNEAANNGYNNAKTIVSGELVYKSQI